MEIVKNLNTLKSLEKKWGMEFDRTYRYCTNEGLFRGDGKYKLKYFDGCFYPFLVKSDEENWSHFSYKSGANPYIAFNNKERDRLLKKYKGKVEVIREDFYMVNDIEPRPKDGPLF